MSFLKLISLIFLSLDAYLGIRFFLNVIGLLQTSKYSQGATLLYAIIFLSLAAVGIYFLFFRSNLKLALWISLAPWLLLFIIQLLSMIFSDQH
ncbi:MAG: hypothetical protein BWX95_02217 [Bacteroidetes bacterium ADurb.Bin141]|nr:hypothetical protein [Bacteroidia bacterium]MBX3106677.1 hypothetical protein [Bacteroidota bacterium]OQB60539.1 MAG: hypothetical protein BWX95_02217 [Bacteroidetes bacterium ADurb.Bin141]MCB0849301.1 hypothetical protein [Bacteroidota bacterium]MCB8931763.1 hypothetical protein [Bacteroidia bacterium]